MASIEDLPGGRKKVRWHTLDGASHPSRICPNAKTAKALQRDVEEAHSLGREWQPEALRRELDLKTVAAAYLEEREVMNTARETLRNLGNYLRIFFRFLQHRDPRATTFSIELLSRPLMMEFLAWLRRPESSQHGTKTREIHSASNIIVAVELMWAWADASERWPDAVIPRPRRVKLPKIPRPTVVAPTWEEMDACVLQTTGWLRCLSTWLRYTGLRVGESMLFLWSDINFERGELTIRKEIDKMKKGRVVPLCTFVLDEIATWGRRDGYLIPRGRRPGPRERISRGRDMSAAWKRAGVREVVWKRRPDHAFRKGFKSNLLGALAHPDALDFLQGHVFGSGSRGTYIDPALLQVPLRETLAKIPMIGTTGKTNVVALPEDGVPTVYLAASGEKAKRLKLK